MIEANYELMKQIETKYQENTGLEDRKDYSIFYGPLCKSKLVIINQNPGGKPIDGGYRIVDVMKGKHELVEGRNSGPSTQNVSDLLLRLLNTQDREALRSIQMLNRYFRRGTEADKQSGMREAAPHLREILSYVEPELAIFGGAGKDGKEISDFASAMNGTFDLDRHSIITGPNGSNEALYFCTGTLSIPGLKPIRVIGTYHPSKWHETFYHLTFDSIKAEFDEVMA